MRDTLLTDTVLLPDAPAAMEVAAPITPEQSLSFVTRTTLRRELPAASVATAL